MGERGLFSDDWFERVLSDVSDVRCPPGYVSVEYRCTAASGELCHHQVFEGGRLVTWRAGRATDPDVCLRQPVTVNLAMLTRRELGNEMMQASRIIDVAGVHGNDGGHGWVPPLDEVRSGWGAGLPAFPGVGELTVQQVVTETPFGDVSVWFRIVGGPIVEAGVGFVAVEPDIVVERRFGFALRERSGAIDVLESLEGGGVQGDNRKLMLFLGGFDTDECTAARRALTSPTDEPLAFLGEVLSSPGWAAAADRLASSVTEVGSVP
jgi:hypothetical protein